jgi:hypothetical protein
LPHPRSVRSSDQGAIVSHDLAFQKRVAGFSHEGFEQRARFIGFTCSRIGDRENDNAQWKSDARLNQ